MSFKVGDVVVHKTSLGSVVGVTSDGRTVVEWAYNEVDPVETDDLFLIESKKVENDPEV